MFAFLKRLFFGAPKETATNAATAPLTRPQPEPAQQAPAAAAPAEPAIITPTAFAPPPFAPQPFAEAAPAPLLLPDDDFDEDGEGFAAPLPGDTENFGMVPSPFNPNAYMIGLVGEQNHAAAVAELREGMAVTLELEAGNPHDHSAIAVVDGQGRVIGYVAADSWLRDAIYGAGAGFSASVLAVEMGSRGFREVVLEVEQSDQPLRERMYQP
ncbi:MAG TPA: HIRAN domain-containing protein [Novosphingobium sp.]|nr:HIRAN domain-containing protein [Novosphingobium sp.]